MNADAEKAVEALRNYTQADADGVMVIASRQAIDEVLQALRDQEAEIARHVRMLADCFRMAGADPDGNEDWRIAPDALRAVTDLRRDYDEVLDWQDRAEKAEALLRQTEINLAQQNDMTATLRMITAHLGGEHE